MIGFAVSDSFYGYKDGVYKPTDCAGMSANHAMQAVGFGVDAATNLPYALVRNSWGVYWGNQGYIKVFLDSSVAGGTCQLHNYVYWSTVGF